MADHPWKKWIPGVLSDKQMKTLCDNDYILGLVKGSKPKESSFDLHLGDKGYRMLQGSVKPSGSRYLNLIKGDFSEELKPDEDGAFTLNKKETYVFTVAERLGNFHEASFYGVATAKSTIGRVDVLARLIVDGADCYESFDPETLRETSGGKMFLEITPFSFPVRVKPGIALTQLRIFYGKPEDAEIRGEELYKALLHRERDDVTAGFLSVDVTPTKVWGQEAAAFSTKSGEDFAPIDLWGKDNNDKPDPKEYWNIQSSIKHDDTYRFKIEKDKFYILRSKEMISLPPGICVYCKANDETIGEMRIHYAGFVHPFFGYDRKDGQKGTPLIFEVRGHDVNVSLGDDEKMCRLIFYRMSEECQKDDDEEPSYGTQILNLSKFFKKVD